VKTNTFIRQKQQTVRAGKGRYMYKERRTQISLPMIEYCKHSHKTGTCTGTCTNGTGTGTGTCLLSTWYKTAQKSLASLGLPEWCQTTQHTTKHGLQTRNVDLTAFCSTVPGDMLYRSTCPVSAVADDHRWGDRINYYRSHDVTSGSSSPESILFRRKTRRRSTSTPTARRIISPTRTAVHLVDNSTQRINNSTLSDCFLTTLYDILIPELL